MELPYFEVYGVGPLEVCSVGSGLPGRPTQYPCIVSHRRMATRKPVRASDGSDVLQADVGMAMNAFNQSPIERYVYLGMYDGEA